MQLPSSSCAHPNSCLHPNASFETELLRCIPALRRYALSLTRDPETSQDLVHDLVALALQKKHLWQAGSNLRAWLFTLLHNIFVNQRRRLSARITAVSLNGELLVTPATQEGNVVLRETQAALDCIPAPQKNVVLLVSVRGFSYAEAAEILHIPLGTVRSRLSRARETLRHAMQ